MSLARPWSVLAAVALLAACGGGGGGGTPATPPEPVALGSATASPANQNAITVQGTTEPGLGVRVFAGGTCDAAPVQELTAGPDGAFSFTLLVADDSTTTLRAQAVAGKLASACGPAFTFVEDSTPPAPPAGVETVPASPSRAGEVVVAGAAEAGSRVQLFADAACTAPAVAEATAQDGFTIPIAVAEEGTVTWWARATDAADNASDCVEAATYVRDLTPPGAPALLATTPPNDQPRQETVIQVEVDAEAGAEVALFADGACGAPAAANVVSAQGRTTVLAVTVPADQVTTLTARAADAADNVSTCSEPLRYVNDRTPPLAPALALATGQASPSQSAEPLFAGGAEPGATVHVYASADCTGPEAATPVAASPVDGAFEVRAVAAANAATGFRALAVDAAGNWSRCGDAVVYVNDTIAPAAPAALATTPRSPANENDPVLGGTAERGARVGLWLDPECAGAPLTSALAGSGPDGDAFALPFHVADDVTAALWVKAVDAAGNPSACTSAGAYVEDSLAPAVPVVVGTTPVADRPRQEASIVVEVSGEADATAALFSDDACLVPLAATPLPQGGNGTSFFAVTVPADAVTTLHAHARDVAGNLSACSAGLQYENDQTPPLAPALALATGQASPSQSAEPLLAGGAEPGATVHVYASADCTGPEAATPVAASPVDGAFEVRAVAAANAVTGFRAVAVDAAGNWSRCGDAVVYVNDTIAPGAPADLATTPRSPANENDPVLDGTAEPGARVGLWLDPGCAGAPLTSAVAGSGPDGDAFALPFHVADDVTTALWVKAVDAAGNASACTSAGLYVEDSLAPAVPVVVGTTPAADRPRQEASIVVEVAGDADATAALFSDDACLVPLAATPLPQGGNGTSFFAVTVPADAVTTLHAHAWDVAGNLSACSAGLRYENDQVAPASPTLASAPTSPGKIVNPVLSGTAEKGATVRVYREAGCAGTPVELTASAQDGSFSAEVTVPADAVTSFWATATDAAGNTGGCPADPQVAYRQDSTPPADPASFAVRPASPANDNLPVVSGTTEADAVVKVHAFLDGVDPGADPCAGPAAAGGVANGGDGTGFAVAVAVADDTTTHLWVQAADAAGNLSRCVAAGTYVEDSRKPGTPVVSTTATSPSQVATLEVTVTAEPGTTVALYAGTGCAFPLVGAPVGGGDAVVPSGGALGLVATVGSNQTTEIGARVTDAAGNVSECSAPLVYTHDTIAPAAPVVAFAPASPSPDPAPVLAGTTEKDARIDVYQGSGCGGVPLATPAVGPDGGFSVPLSPGVEAITVYSVRSTDLAGNTAPGSCATLSYRHDSLPPATPVLTGVKALDANRALSPNDGSVPSADPGPLLSGTLSAIDPKDVGVKVRVWANACGGQLLTTFPVTVTTAQDGTQSGSFTVAVPVPRNTATTFAADAVDDAGNASGCTTGITFRHDDTPPAFAGLVSATATGTDRIHLQWSAASDTASPPAKLTYEVCVSADWGGCLAAYTVQQNVPGSGAATFGADVAGLAIGTRYTFLVVAKDEAGNRDPNEVQHLARTWGDGAVAAASGGSNVSTRFTCVLDAGGRVVCLGPAGPQLGGGDGVSGPVLGIPERAVSVAAGEGHACAVSEAGKVYCWGRNEKRQVAPTAAAASVSPATQVFYGSSTPAIAVRCGRLHTCALLADGTVRCWGRNEAGQLGTGAVTSGSPDYLTGTPVQVAGVSGAVALAAGEKHACALLGNGRLQCWGDRTLGQLGDGTALSPAPAPATAPVFFGGAALAGEAFQAVDAGWNHTCALTINARMWCAGDASQGQIGNGAVTPNVPTPFQVVAVNVRQLALGRNHSCATLSDGSPMCWGDDAFGQMGNWGNPPASKPDQTIPLAVPSGPSAWQGLFAGGDETCGLRAGTLMCWGTSGLFGNPTPPPLPVRLPLNGPSGLLAIASGRTHTCVLTGDGLVRCVGSNALGQLGTGDGLNSAAAQPVTSLSARGALAAGGDSTCAGGPSGATCWGSNAFGQIGDANPSNWPDGNVVGGSRPEPTRSRPDWPVVIADHACGARGNGVFGAAECWGQNDRDQLGASTNGLSTAEGVNVTPSPLSVRVLTVGARHSCAVLRDGEVDCWGDNLEGQLGSAGTEPSPFRASAGPIYDDTGAMVAAVEVDAGGGDTTCARFVSGEVWCWGRNDYGQLGRGTAGAPDDVATGVSGLCFPATARAVDVAVGPRHACAVIADGTIRCWGANEAGQLGDGTSTDRHAPVQAAGVTGARQVVVGDAHTCARLADGTARCWGANAAGQLGDGTATGRATSAPAETLP
jgi:alpha-tubulin suppressor-like RCC1 family protein